MIFLSIESNLFYILKHCFSLKPTEILHNEIKLWLLHQNINPFIVINGSSKDTNLPSVMSGTLGDLFDPYSMKTGVSLSPIISTMSNMLSVLEQDNYFGFDKNEDALLFKLTWI